MPFKSDKRMFLNADKSAVVDADSPDAAFLFVAEGQTVSDEDAEKYGLEAPAEADADEAEGDEGEADTKAESKPRATKAMAKAKATKARK
jgi:hypothetical protein